jgi:hypothetical protein
MIEVLNKLKEVYNGKIIYSGEIGYHAFFDWMTIDGRQKRIRVDLRNGQVCTSAKTGGWKKEVWKIKIK